jgi:hypothetical protein
MSGYGFHWSRCRGSGGGSVAGVVLAVAGVVAVAAWLRLHLWLVAAAAGTAVACYALSVAIALTVARLDRGHRALAARRVPAARRPLTIRAQTVRLSDTGRPPVAGERPAVARKVISGSVLPRDAARQPARIMIRGHVEEE